METAELKKLVEKLAPEALLQCVRFGKSSEGCAWVETNALVGLCRALKNESGLRLDWLENLSAMQMDDVVVLTYFIRSQSSEVSCRLRSSVAIEEAEEWVKFPSVAEVWTSAEMFEREISEMFGVAFSPSPSNSQASNESEFWKKTAILPEGWKGFPLRKSYSLNLSITTPDAGGLE